SSSLGRSGNCRIGGRLVAAVLPGATMSGAPLESGSRRLSGMLVGPDDMCRGFQRQFDGGKYALSVPQTEKRGTQQSANNHITPKRYKAQSQSVNQQITSQKRTISVASCQPQIPTPKRLDRDDRGVNRHHHRQKHSEESEEINIGHFS